MIVKEKRMSLGSEVLGKIRRVYLSKKRQVYRLSKDVQDVALEGFAFKTRTLKEFQVVSLCQTLSVLIIIIVKISIADKFGGCLEK